MKQFDHPMFEKLWVRILIVAICAAWGGFEYYNGSPTWAAIFWAAGAYAIYHLFITFKPAGSRDKEDGQ